MKCSPPGIRLTLQDARGASRSCRAGWPSLVLAAGAFGTFFGGWLTDWLVQDDRQPAVGSHGAGGRRRGLGALGILASIWTDSTVAASAFVALAAFGVQLQLPAWWASATQVSGRHLGALFGIMNMMGGVGRILSQLFVGRFADWRKSLGYSGRAQWDPALYAYVAIALIGMVLWGLINPEKTVDRKGTVSYESRSNGKLHLPGHTHINSRRFANGRNHFPKF